MNHGPKILLSRRTSFQDIDYILGFLLRAEGHSWKNPPILFILVALRPNVGWAGQEVPGSLPIHPGISKKLPHYNLFFGEVLLVGHGVGVGGKKLHSKGVFVVKPYKLEDVE